MRKYFRLFDTHEEYEAYTADTSSFIKPNVSYCIDTPIEVHYNPLRCDETTVYDIIGSPLYPSTIEGDATSFDITVNYRRTDTDLHCKETVIEGTDAITVECGQNPSTSDSRVVSGTVEWNGNEIEYSLTQSKFEEKVTAKFNVTSTSSPTQIASNTTNFSKIEIDGVKKSGVSTGHTFDTIGEHTIKYTLKDPTSIGANAFTRCYNLESIDIPDSVTSIGNNAFYECSGLTSCAIGSGVTSIGDYAFLQCTSLTSIEIPDSITYIGIQAFKYCSGLTSIDIPDSVTSIGGGAFSYCSGLTSIDIPDSVTSIDGAVFSYCRSLTSIDIPDSVTSIGDSTFYACNNLRSIDIPDSVTSIGQYAFGYCTRLTSINIPNSVTSIGERAFQYCSGITSCTIGSGVTSIDIGAFEHCSGLTSIDIPDSVTSIGGAAFTWCTSLSSCTIGSGVTSIGQYALYYCISLTSITCNAASAPIIQNGTFQYIKTHGTLYVPIGSSGYDTWMQNDYYYLGLYNWTKVEQ